jgi:site-specific DNA-methyltransferase (adenine-specific)
MEILPGLNSRSAAMILADLPYGTTNCKWDSPIDLQRLWPEFRRVCRGAIVLFAQSPFDKMLGMSNIKELRHEWIWEKGNATGHLNANRAPMKAHENILVFSAGGYTYNPQMTSGHARKVSTKKRREDCPVYNEHDRTPYDSTTRYPRDVLRFSSDKQRGGKHPTQKPLALCEYLIRTYSNPGDTILDNVMGSGTTGHAAINTGRNFIGIELEGEYFVMAQKRLELSRTKAA